MKTISSLMASVLISIPAVASAASSFTPLPTSPLSARDTALLGQQYKPSDTRPIAPSHLPNNAKVLYNYLIASCKAPTSRAATFQGKPIRIVTAREMSGVRKDHLFVEGLQAGVASVRAKQ